MEKRKSQIESQLTCGVNIATNLPIYVDRSGLTVDVKPK